MNKFIQFLIYLVSIIIVIVWAAHQLMPIRFHWLNSIQLTTINALVFFGIIAVLLRRLVLWFEKIDP